MSIMIMSRMFKIKLGSQSRKIMAVRLADFADDDGRGIWPTVARLSRETELSERSVQRILSDFVEEGLLVVVKEASGRPGQATRYDFDLVAIERLEKGVSAALATGDTVSPVACEAGVTSTTETGDTSDRDGCHHDTRTVIEPPVEPSTERDARKRGPDGNGEEDPKAISKAFKRWYPSWPTYVDDSEPKAFKAWLDLSPEDRLVAVEKSAAYVAAVKAAGRQHVCAAQTYLTEKRWEKLPEKASEDARKASQSGGRVTVAVLGPTWAAAAFVPLLGKPVPVRLPDDHRSRVAAAYEMRSRYNAQRAMAYLSAKGIAIGDDGELVFPDGFERAEERLLRMEDGYPETKRLYEASKDRSAVSLDQRFDDLKSAMEFVPVDSAMMEAWRDHYAANFLPMPPIGQRGGFFPKGGPEALDGFRQAVEAVIAHEGMSDDAA